MKNKKTPTKQQLYTSLCTLESLSSQNFKIPLAPLFFFLSPPPVCIQAASSHAAVSMAISICVRNSLTLSCRSFHAEIPRRIQIGAERGILRDYFWQNATIPEELGYFWNTLSKLILCWCWQPLSLHYEGNCRLLHQGLTFELKKNRSEGNLNGN